MKLNKVLCLCLMLIGFVTIKVNAQSWNELIKLEASDVSSGDGFGYAVDIFENKAVVGTPGNDDDGGNSGSVYIFELIDNNWIETHKLTASDADTNDLFGNAVCMHEDRVVIGARRDKDNGINSGSVYIFDFDGTSWEETQKITASDAEENSYFGQSISLFEDRICVGSSKMYVIGEVYIFELNNGSWTETVKLSASDGTLGDAFGRTHSIYENTLLVGASGNDISGNLAGAAYVFEFDNNQWEETQILLGSDSDDNDFFGFSVDVYADKLIIGANRCNIGGNLCGAAYVFDYDGTSWVETQKLLASDTVHLSEFGGEVTIENNTVVVGAMKNSDNGINSGTAYIYELTNNSWLETQKINASDSESFDEFGNVLAISNDNIIVGAHNNTTNQYDEGSAYLFSTSTLGVNAQSNINEEVLIYPNPITGKLTIDVNVLNASTIQVYSILGKEIMTIKPTSNKTNIDISEQENGVYIIKVMYENYNVVSRVIKK